MTNGYTGWLPRSKPGCADEKPNIDCRLRRDRYLPSFEIKLSPVAATLLTAVGSAGIDRWSTQARADLMYMEETNMQDYQYLAAITAVTDALDSLPQAPNKLPHSVVADWLEEQGIDAEDILLVSGSEVRAIVSDLVERGHPSTAHTA